MGSANVSRDSSGPWHVGRCDRRILLSVSIWPIGAVRPNGPAQTPLDVSRLAGAHEQRRSCIMAKNEYHSEQMESVTPFSLIPPAFITMGRQQIHECVKAHSELVDRFQEVNRNWLDHLQSEAALSTEFASKMTAARSIPDVAALLLEWNKRHMEMANVDAKHVLADTQKVMEVGARLLAGGWLVNDKDRGSMNSAAAAPSASATSPPSSARTDRS